jgi:glutathione S-transferase
MDDRITQGVPGWQAKAFRFARPVMTALLKRGLNITPEGVQRSLVKIDEAFARVDQLLADGRPFLCGEHFTVADLTFASLAAPVLSPPGHPYRIDLPLPPEREASKTRLLASAAGKHALRMYAEQRHDLYS